MAFLHWRKFAFFDEEKVEGTQLNKLVDEQDNKDIITVRLSCSSSGRGSLLLGDENGYVHVVNKHLKINSFKANEKHTSHVKQVPKLPIFITAGSDQDGINPLIKLWDPEKTDKFNQPTCIKVIRANSGFTTPVRVSCIECSDTLALMVIGYEDGTVVLFQDVAKRRRSKKSGLLKIGDTSITAIVVLDESKMTCLITTENKIFRTRFNEVTEDPLDDLGCRPKCFCQAHGDLFALGRNDAVYFYGVDGRGACLAFEGEKLLLYRFKAYLVIISRLSKDRYIHIYDLKNKYIAHSSTIPEVQEVISEWGHLFVICVNGKIIRLREKDIQTKLETLYKKNQFSLVIDIAKSLQYDEDALADIYKHYGDHLFRERDFDGSIAQYIKTIGRLEPTFVIKRFLTSKRYRNLAVYLEALHQKAQAGPEHTKILQNCYSKLGDESHINEFKGSLSDQVSNRHETNRLLTQSQDSLSFTEDGEPDWESDQKVPEDSPSEKPSMPILLDYSMNGDARLSQLLKDIERQKAIAPMVVIKTLLNSKKITLESVKDYLVGFLAKSDERHNENLSSIDYHENDTELLRQKIDEFKNNQTIFHPSKCSVCLNGLDLPSVHFLCNHCYHQNCFYKHSAEDDECPHCITSNRKLLGEISSHETGKLFPDRLRELAVRPGEDVYKNVAELFGYGLLN